MWMFRRGHLWASGTRGSRRATAYIGRESDKILRLTYVVSPRGSTEATYCMRSTAARIFWIVCLQGVPWTGNRPLLDWPHGYRREEAIRTGTESRDDGSLVPTTSA